MINHLFLDETLHAVASVNQTTLAPAVGFTERQVHTNG
jgi:hypothetical protein